MGSRSSASEPPGALGKRADSWAPPQVLRFCSSGARPGNLHLVGSLDHSWAQLGLRTCPSEEDGGPGAGTFRSVSASFFCILEPDAGQGGAWAGDCSPGFFAASLGADLGRTGWREAYQLCLALCP